MFNTTPSNIPPIPSIHILCDFDGTISLDDTTDTLLKSFAKNGWEDIEEQWENGIIGSQLCMKNQIELLDMSVSDFHSCLDKIELDSSFLDLLNFCTNNDIQLTIVSDGLDLAIQYLLQKNNLGHFPIVSNKLIQTDEFSWSLQFPNANPLCIAASGTCKCQVAEQYRHQKKIILIGDGRSDFCLAKNADYVFAKASLTRHCEEHGIPFQPIHSLSDSISHLESFLHLDLVAP